MREMLTPTAAVAGMGLDKDVALITDGRFSEQPEAPLSAMFHRKQWSGAHSGGVGRGFNCR